MKYYSTNNSANFVSFKDAVLKGIADDGGLYMPSVIPSFPSGFISNLNELSFNDIAFEISKIFIDDEIPAEHLKLIINKAFYFDAPLVKMNEQLNILELFNGPTFAFKDFGARFMACTMSYFLQNSDDELTILVATSGDTGSAVANGFYNVEGIKVVLLYPSQKVSEMQEKQLTTLGGNITPLEVDGTFDDCQKLVKQSFLDEELKNKLNLSSANSINIARLLPQSFYYFYAFAQLKDKDKPLIFSVPCGNFGNLTAGLFAKKMGLPVYKFIAALNSNDVFKNYLLTGKMHPKPSVRTISNAMDVGNPSNFARIISLFNNDWNKIKKEVWSSSFSDEETKKAIKEIYSRSRYIIDPHGAVGYLAIKDYIKQNKIDNINGIILETAHPAKFIDIVEEVTNIKINLPEELNSITSKEKKSVKISNEYSDLKNLLLNLN